MSQTNAYIRQKQIIDALRHKASRQNRETKYTWKQLKEQHAGFLLFDRVLLFFFTLLNQKQAKL